MTPTGYPGPGGEGHIPLVCSVCDLLPLGMAFVAMHDALVAGFIQKGREGAEPSRADTSESEGRPVAACSSSAKASPYRPGPSNAPPPLIRPKQRPTRLMGPSDAPPSPRRALATTR